MIAGIAGWWLSRQRLMAKPWLEAGPVTAFPATEASATHPAKIGLGVFLAVVGALFALLISAYFMRMADADWQAAADAARALAQHRHAGAEQRRAAMRGGRRAQRRRSTIVRLALARGAG